MSKILKLNNGYEIPMMGLGTYKSGKGEVAQAFKDAIDAGYGHFDCAWFYGNEEEVGEGLQSKIQDGTVNREDVFVTSKLWINFHAKDRVVPMIKESLKALKLDYLDLYLIHVPFGFKEDADYLSAGEDPSLFSDVDYLETWEGMEECVKKGLAKSIGISNFNSKQTDCLLEVAGIKPRERDIVVVGYCPLGPSDSADLPGIPKPTIFDTKVIEMGKKYNKTAAQVVLNYLIGFGISVIPKSVTKSRIIENINVFDFELDKKDEYLNSLDKNQRICVFKAVADHKYYPFKIEF